MSAFLLVALKLAIGFLALITVINITGKGNLAPTSAESCRLPPNQYNLPQKHLRFLTIPHYNYNMMF